MPGRLARSAKERSDAMVGQLYIMPGRLMVGHTALNRVIGVRISAGQPRFQQGDRCLEKDLI